MDAPAPMPLLSLAIAPRSDLDRRKALDAIRALRSEDPSISSRLDETNGTIVIGAVGELQLEIFLDRLRREFGVEAGVGRPQVNYAETIAEAADGEAKYAATVEGRGQYAHVKLRLDPLHQGSGLVFENDVGGGAIPERFFAAIEEGVRNAASRGMLAGGPVVDLRVVLYDGSYHDVDSTAGAFKTAAAFAFDDAAKRAKPVLLEPIMEVVVHSGPSHVADIAASLMSRKGRIRTVRDDEGDQVDITALVPLSGLFGFAHALRFMTSGRCTFAMRLDSYQPVETEDNSGDRDAFVTEPRPPVISPRRGSIALPEPPDDSDTDN